MGTIMIKLPDGSYAIQMDFVGGADIIALDLTVKYSPHTWFEYNGKCYRVLSEDEIKDFTL